MTSTERWGAITGIKHITEENYKYRIHANLTEALSLLAGWRDHSEHLFLLQGQIAWARVERPQISPVSNEKGKAWRKLLVVVQFFDQFGWTFSGEHFNSNALDYKGRLQWGWTGSAVFWGVFTHLQSVNLNLFYRNQSVWGINSDGSVLYDSRSAHRSSSPTT